MLGGWISRVKTEEPDKEGQKGKNTRPNPPIKAYSHNNKGGEGKTIHPCEEQTKKIKPRKVNEKEKSIL